MKKKFKLSLTLDDAQLFQAISFTNGFVAFHPEPGNDPFFQLLHKLYNEAQRVAPPELFEDAKRLSDKMLPVWNEPSVERGAALGGFEGLLDKSIETLTDEDKEIIERYRPE